MHVFRVYISLHILINSVSSFSASLRRSEFSYNAKVSELSYHTNKIVNKSQQRQILNSKNKPKLNLLTRLIYLLPISSSPHGLADNILAYFIISIVIVITLVVAIVVSCCSLCYYCFCTRRRIISHSYHPIHHTIDHHPYQHHYGPVAPPQQPPYAQQQQPYYLPPSAPSESQLLYSNTLTPTATAVPEPSQHYSRLEKGCR